MIISSSAVDHVLVAKCSPTSSAGQTTWISPLRSVGGRPVHDGSRTRAEARIAIKPGVPDPHDPESRFDSDAGRVFPWWDVTSGLPDDSREADERQEARRLADLRGRVKVARALVATTPGLAEILQHDPRRRALFFARPGFTEEQFRKGASDPAALDGQAASPTLLPT